MSDPSVSPSAQPDSENSTGILRFVRALGPAIIVASVVLGPGSILSSSKVGATYGFGMVWVLIVAAALMMGMVALGARLGVTLQGSMCDELASRVGRPLAVLVGFTIFFVCAGFQFGNNLGVLAAIEPFLEPAAEQAADADAQGSATEQAKATDQGGASGQGGASKQAGGLSSLLSLSNLILLGLNIAVIAFLYGSRHLYKPVERLMMLLVGLMILAFFGNFIFLLASGGDANKPTSDAVETASSDSGRREDAGASNSASEAGEQAQAESETGKQEVGKQETGKGAAASGAFLAVLALIGTTFSVAGAFYQAYLVREKGWGLKQAKSGMIDSVAGIAVLGSITLVIMLTSAISFYGKDVQLGSAADVARQLEPLFGPFAVVLFSLGIFAGSFSSFLVNAMIGGAMLADGLGLGGKMDSAVTKAFTTVALVVGMLVAMFVPAGNRVGLVVFAQAMVVIGFPLLAGSMLFLATRPDLTGERRIPTALKIVAAVGLVVVILAAGRLGWTLVERLMALQN